MGHGVTYVSLIVTVLSVNHSAMRIDGLVCLVIKVISHESATFRGGGGGDVPGGGRPLCGRVA